MKYYAIHSYRKNGEFRGYQVQKTLENGEFRVVAIIFHKDFLKKFLKWANEKK